MEEHVIKHYPNARPGLEVTYHYINKFENELQLDLSKTLFATSVCTDDINVSTDFRKFLTRPFSLGGLGGLPFTGLTGMIAYAHHIPDEGTGFIFYGPHIGVSPDGEPGKVIRHGQKRISHSCGALMLALSRLRTEAESIPNPLIYDLDFQQMMLEKTIQPHKSEILNSEYPIVTTTNIIYDKIREQILKYISMAKPEFKCKKVVLLGGIIINTGPNFQDYVDIQHFEAIDIPEVESKADKFNELLQLYKDLQ